MNKRIAVTICLALLSMGCGQSKEVQSLSSGAPSTADVVVADQEPITDSKLTFNDVAPFVWEKCACCHRPGEAGPFSLIASKDFSKRREQILQVVRSGYMPPWLPDAPHGFFENDTRLTDSQKRQLVEWLSAGAPEGDSSTLPRKPDWPSGWQLGEPDLIVSMSKEFELPASGPDVYRNFVIPIPTDRIRFVRGMEFRPGNDRVVHHAFMLIDATRRLRALDGEDGQPGFAGMDTKSAASPDGHFVGWQPGRRPYEAPDGMPWRLYPNTDLVVQVHMQCTGKPEKLKLSVGLFFTDEAPKRIPSKLALHNQEIDIPAGEARYELTDQFQVPVDVDVMAVAPHAHYLGKEMYGTALLPDGTTKSLMTIRDWDLNWQSEYRFREWIRLPAGTVLKQRFVYDNSTANVRNPSTPPRRVTFGQDATDEMGSLWVQLIAANDADAPKLTKAINLKGLKELIARKRKVLREEPNNVDAHIQLGKVAVMAGQFSVALRHFRQAQIADPKSVDATYYVGHVLVRSKNVNEGVKELKKCAQLDPTFYKAHHDLGQAALMQKNYKTAETHYRDALKILAHSAPTLKQLGKSLLAQGRVKEGLQFMEKSLLVAPDAKLAKEVEQVRSHLK